MRAFVAVTAGALAVAALAVAPATANAAGASSGPTVVVTGLNNPRQLSWADAGHHQLLIAEAGRGGPNCSGSGEERLCLGPTGSVSFVYNPQLRVNSRPYRLVKGLLSGAGSDGGFAVGPDGVDADNLNHLYIAMVAAPPDLPPIPALKQAGKLLRTSAGVPHVFADITKVELTKNPDGQQVDSNPYAVLRLPDGRTLVADAAGNDIVAVSPSGKTSVFVVLPDHGDPATSRDSVPTSLALGPDGNVYVGELAHEEAGQARVWKISPHGKILGWRGGFTTITGIAFGTRGTLFVSQLFAGGGPNAAPGLLTRVRGNTRTDMPVPFPAGVAVDRWDNVYVSAWSIADSDGIALGPNTSPPGQVWKVRF